MPFKLRPIVAAWTLAALSASAFAAGPIQSVTKLWSFSNSAGYSSEIGAWDAGSQALFVVGGKGIQVLDLAGNLLQSYDATAAGLGAVNSISIANGIAAVAFSNPVAQNPGTVQFFDTALFRTSGGAAASLGGVGVGAVPDMLTWTAGGTQLLVANEGERQSNLINPAGGISFIDFNAAAPTSSAVTTIGFAAFDGQEASLRAAGVRISAGLSASVALEPEYIAISVDGRQAHVTLQEANAVAIIDLGTRSVSSIRGLGMKDYRAPGNAIDPSDRDGVISLRSVPVKGLYMPDSVASYNAGGRSYYVMANEGDAATDDSDIVRFGNAAVTLNPAVFDGVSLPTQAQLKPDSVLGRMNIVNNGATGIGNTTNMNEIVVLGGRSFSIRDDQGVLVFDSGNQLEQAVIAAGLYDDNRSDDKGVEPEGVALFTVLGRTIAAIGLERTTQAVVALYDVTEPANASFLQLVVTGLNTQFRVEGITAFEAGGRIFMAMHNEDPSNNTVLFEITPVPEPGAYALMAGGLLAVGALARRRRR